MQKQIVVLSIILTSFLVGCSSKDAMLPVPKESMKSVYEKHMSGTASGKLFDSRSIVRRSLEESDVNLSDYVRTESTQLHSKFKRIPNPTLYMFVAPHLATDSKVPVPGYLTEFKMWEKEHYALPGEVSDMSSSFTH